MLQSQVEYLWNFLGDREVWFPKEKGNVMTGSAQCMLDAFEFLVLKDNLVFWRLKKDAYYEDPYGSFRDIAADMKPDQLSVFSLRDNENNELDVVEQWTTIPESWYHEHKMDENMELSLKNYLNSKH